jgi:hypothetical protein
LLNIRAVAVAEDWSVLAVADAFEQLMLYDPTTGEHLYTQSLQAVRVAGLVVSPDGGALAVYLLREGEADGVIQIWGRGQP